MSLLAKFLTTSLILINSSYASLKVDTPLGSIRGFVDGEFVTFTKIPYAQPPVNEKRFKPPHPITTKWNITYNATEPLPACIQSTDESFPTYTSEDCLYLNIFTPNDANEQSLYPVLLYIHGGDFVRGFGGDPMNYPYQLLKHKQSIFVSINYRLGPLGSLYDASYGTNIKGNYGILDQIMAIEWTYDNIRYFGGNPNKICILGTSAGASSVAIHMTNLNFKNKISAAIMQSPSIGFEINSIDRWTILKYDQTFISATDCNLNQSAQEIENCLKYNLTTDKIIEITDTTLALQWPMFSWAPTVDGNIIKYQPMSAFHNGEYLNIPFIASNTEEEGILLSTLTNFLYFGNGNSLKNAFIEYFYNDTILVDSFYDYFGFTIETDITKVANIFYKYFWFECPMRKLMNDIVSNDNYNKNGYFYLYNQKEHELYSQLYGAISEQCVDNVCHGADGIALFLPPFFNYSDQFVNLSHSYQDGIFEFVHFGEISSFHWSLWTKDRPNTLFVNFNQIEYLKKIDFSVIVNQSYPCDFFDNIGYTFRDEKMDESSSFNFIWILIVSAICVCIFLAAVVAKYKSHLCNDNKPHYANMRELGTKTSNKHYGSAANRQQL
eukprot:218600_1